MVNYRSSNYSIIVSTTVLLVFIISPSILQVSAHSAHFYATTISPTLVIVNSRPTFTVTVTNLNNDRDRLVPSR